MEVWRCGGVEVWRCGGVGQVVKAFLHFLTYAVRARHGAGFLGRESCKRSCAVGAAGGGYGGVQSDVFTTFH